MSDRLPQRETTEEATVWWLGTHGGSGESTLATLTAGTRPAGHAWPLPALPDVTNRVVLVARTDYRGLVAARAAATEWAAGTVGEGVQLAGLVLLADAPGRTPRPLREFEDVIAGGVPRVWRLPWVDAWRFGPVTASDPLPHQFRSLFSELSLTPSVPPSHP